ncbi:MAG: hypothetical protein IJ562_12440 [Prevotella sp.]|nr:hypothetical protein [Prevotella sp.]
MKERRVGAVEPLHIGRGRGRWMFLLPLFFAPKKKRSQLRKEKEVCNFAKEKEVATAPKKKSFATVTKKSFATAQLITQQVTQRVTQRFLQHADIMYITRKYTIYAFSHKGKHFATTKNEVFPDVSPATSQLLSALMQPLRVRNLYKII